MKKDEFEKLSIKERRDQLKMAGDFVGSRLTSSHRVHLFTYSGLFVEVYVYIPTDQVHWIEVQTNQSILQEYINDLDIFKSSNL